MITVIRSKIMGSHAYLMWAFVLFVIISLGLPGTLQKSASSGPWILKVNEQEVGYNSFVRTLQAQEQIARQKYGTFAPMINQTALYNQTFDALIYAELLDQAAAKAGISVSACYAATALSDPRFIIPILVKLQALQAYSWHTGVDMRVLRKILFDKGMTIADFDREVARALSQDLIQQMVFVAGYSPAFEVEHEYKQHTLGKTFRVVTLPLSHFVALEQQAGITKPELQAFYNTHKQQYSQPEKRSATVWEFTPATFAAALTPQQIEAYYEKHKETSFVQEPVKVQVRRILLAADDRATAQELKKALDANPETFARKAREVSIDKASADQGGLLQPFARGTHDAAFDKAAFLLSATDAISDVITTKDGLELIQLVQRFAKTYKPLKAVQKEIVDALSLKQFNDAFELESKRIVRQEDTKALQDFIANHHGTRVPYQLVTRQSSPMAERFFGLSVGRPTTFVEHNKGYIVEITAVEPSFIPALSAIEDRVTKDLIEQKAAKKLETVLQKIKGSKGDLQAVADQYKGTLITIDNLKADDTKGIESYTNRGLPVEKMLQLEKTGATAVMQTASGGYLVRLERIEPFDAKAFDEAKSSLAASLNQERMQLTLVGFIASARRNATIKQNDAINMRGQ